MFVVYDDDVPPPRQHPWTTAGDKPDAVERYWDFRNHPEQISVVLEDFKPYEHHAAVPRFYELLGWVNGDDSLFESNDCGLRPPSTGKAVPEVIRAAFESEPIAMHARLVI